jgi:hypothetical protein
MADKKISELDVINGADTAADDFFVVVDTSGSVTKKISRAELNNAIEQDVLAQVDITSANIDGGTIDNTPIGSTTASTGNFTTVDTTGNVTVGGNLTVQGTTVTVDTATVQTVDLGDNDKIRLGNSRDLQLYHDGSQSFIDQVGNGSLLIRNTTPDADVLIYSDDGSGGEALYIQADGSNGRTRLYNYGSEKLSTRTDGIVITGTLTADGLTVDGSVNPITVVNGARTGLQLTQTGGGTGYVTLTDANEALYIRTSDGSVKSRLSIAANGDISFYDSTGTTQGFFWDASTQRLGLGETSPDTALHAKGSITVATIESTAANSDIQMKGSGTTGYTAVRANAETLALLTAGTNAITIDGSQNVGIGTSSVAAKLDIRGMTGTTTEAFLIGYGANGDNYYTSGSSGSQIFRAANTERMRIDGGDLLVGTTDTTVYDNNADSSVDNGLNLRGDGKLDAARYNGPVLGLNRTGTDGTLAEFRRSGTTVASIGTKTSTPYFVRSTGGGIALVADSLCPADSTGSPRDDYYSLGLSTNRFSDLYLAGGVYLGGTGAANYLDDYEEGTWTPSATSANGDAVVSTSIESATYTKVGNLVNVRCYITLTVTSVGTGNARITGLPFTNNGYYTPFTSTHETFAGSTGQGFVKPTNTQMEFLNANSTSTLPISGTGTKYAMISLTYKTDS